MSSILSKTYNFSGNLIFIAQQLSDRDGFIFLDSSLKTSSGGRYSFLLFDPFDQYQSKDTDSLDGLENEWQTYFDINRDSPLTPFTCGIAGFLSYDFGLKKERVNFLEKETLDLPDLYFNFYDTAITIDHKENLIHVTSSGLPETNDSSREKRAAERLREACLMIEPILIKNSTEFGIEQNSFNSNEGLLFDYENKDHYINSVKRALDYIAQGEIYQVNLSQKFCWPKSIFNWDSFKAYSALRIRSQSSFSAYLDGGSFQILSNSPEQFLKSDGNYVWTRPMKGTRRRGETDEEDLKFYNELIESEKERAELLMVTDLLRNDLGKTCSYGSVEVIDMRKIEQYETVFQATSLIRGKLADHKNAFDILNATYPGGSITGCPKIRSMQIISELEPVNRSVYTGSLGYISFCGKMEFNILIRTLLAVNDSIHCHVGSGIVADSIPEQEYDETLIKARAIQSCLNSLHREELICKKA